MKTILPAGITLACVLGLGTSAAAQSQPRPTIAVMPTQHFAADARSAGYITDGLVSRFEAQGYRVLASGATSDAYRGMGLKPNRHYADKVAIKFGRRMGADLVAYPRLLALGLPASNLGDNRDNPAAVVLLRVINVRTGAAIYCRQIGHEFSAPPAARGAFFLPPQVADATAAEVTQTYFERVADRRAEVR